MRVHRWTDEATRFNPATGAARGRFHPFATAAGPVPVLYAGATLRAAISETVFHDIPVRGEDRRVFRRRLIHYQASTLLPRRPLKLARLYSTGLRRLRVTRGELIETDAAHYDQTVAWGRALHASPAQPDGLVWMSRQDDTTQALVLFGDRVLSGALTLDAREGIQPLGIGRGLDEVSAIALESDITIVM